VTRSSSKNSRAQLLRGRQYLLFQIARLACLEVRNIFELTMDICDEYDILPLGGNSTKEDQ
jgi:hypothetical protein